MAAEPGSTPPAGPLVCPSCGDRRPGQERLCSYCHVPLVALAAGELVRVARGRNQAEAEMLQGLLREEGVPSLLRRAPGFDVPDFLAAGPRDVFVPQAACGIAAQVLRDWGPDPSTGSPEVSAVRLGVGLGVGLLVVALVVWVRFELMI